MEAMRGTVSSLHSKADRLFCSSMAVLSRYLKIAVEELKEAKVSTSTLLSRAVVIVDSITMGLAKFLNPGKAGEQLIKIYLNALESIAMMAGEFPAIILGSICSIIEFRCGRLVLSCINEEVIPKLQVISSRNFGNEEYHFQVNRLLVAIARAAHESDRISVNHRRKQAKSIGSSKTKSEEGPMDLSSDDDENNNTESVLEKLLADNFSPVKIELEDSYLPFLEDFLINSNDGAVQVSRCTDPYICQMPARGMNTIRVPICCRRSKEASFQSSYFPIQFICSIACLIGGFD